MDSLNVGVLAIICLLAFAVAEFEEWWQGRKYRKEVQRRLEEVMVMERLTGRIADSDYDYYGEVDRRDRRD